MNNSHNTISSSGQEMPAHPSRALTLGLAALAVLLYVVLVDAAVESFVSHSPLRWIICGAVAAYVALSVLLWRKLSWTTKATVSFFVLFSLMVFAAWRPEGSDSPLTLLRQPTSTLLSAATILGILLAGWILARLKLLPWPARVALVLLGAYGVAAFVVGIMARTPYAALLHGGSLWEKLPFWLQGAFLSTVVVIPVSLVVDIIQRIQWRWRRVSSAWQGFQQTAAVAMSFILAVSGLRNVADLGIVPPFEKSSAELSLPGGATLLAPEPPPTPVNAGELVARLDAFIQKTPEARYSLAAMAGTLGQGIEPAFLFVRDNIRYQAYAGVLRGDEQAFLARAGNSFDRSLILANLLKLKGVPTRFASGHLSRAEAEKLFARIFETPRPEGVMPASQGAVSPEATAFLSRVKARGRRDYMAIRAALGRTLPSDFRPSQEDVLREIEQHFWVQAQVDGRWIDLDSAFGDATPGRSYCQVERTFDQPPEEAYQRVTMRVVSETLADNQINRETALESTFTAEHLLDRQVFLTHTPAGQAALGGTGGPPQGGNVWAPVLWVAGDFYSGKPIDFSTEGSPSGGAANLFGEAFASPPVFVAEWLEFELSFPDGHREVTRRVLADRGLAWRNAGTPDAGALRPLARDGEGPLAPRALHNIWFSAGGHDLAAYARALSYLVRSSQNPASAQPSTPVSPPATDQTAAPEQPSAQAQPSAPVSSSATDQAAAPEQPPASGQASAPAQSPPSDLSFGELVWPLALQNFAFLVWSDDLIIPAINDSPAVRLYADSPRILMFSMGLDPQGKGGAYGEYDLRRDCLRGVAREPSAQAGVIERKIWFGALEGALEHEAATRDALYSGDDPAMVRSTSSLLTSDGAIALRPQNSPPGAGLARDPETAARMALALSSGSSLVVPRPLPGGGPLGWWEITGAGDTRAVFDADLNIATTSYVQGYVNASKGNVYRVYADGSCRQLNVIATRPKEGRGGNEYTITLRAIALTVIGIIAVVMIIWRVHAQQARGAAAGVEAADARYTVSK